MSAPLSTMVGASYEVEAPAVPFLGFSTAAVVDATAEVVHDLIGFHYDPHGDLVLPPAGVDMVSPVWARSTVARRLKISGGTVELDVKWPRPFGKDSGPWRDTELTRREQFINDRWGWDDDVSDDDDDLPRRGVIREWSPRSRSRMVKALADIDHDSWLQPHWRLAMVTLTLPDNWLAVAPKGEDFKAAFRRFEFRWLKAGLPWQCVWKLEFQRRGAPHLHMMIRVPDESWRDPRGRAPFRMWLSRAWADSVRSDRVFCHRCQVERCDCFSPDTEYARHLSAGTNVDFGFRGTDPKRISVYFLKHSAKTMDSKEYQHQVPQQWWRNGHGPGRFWGVAGLDRHIVTVELTARAWVLARRILKGVHRGNMARAALSRRAHAISGFGESVRRATIHDLRIFGKRKTRVFTDPLAGGWLISQDAPALAYRIAHHIALSEPDVLP